MFSIGVAFCQPKNDAYLAGLLGLVDVLHRTDLEERVLELLEAVEPGSDVVERGAVVLPDGNGGIDGGHAPGVQAAIDGGTLPIADVEAVNDDGLVIQPLCRRIYGCHAFCLLAAPARLQDSTPGEAYPATGRRGD